MKKIMAILITLFSVSSFANNCEIAYPGQKDERGAVCAGRYGVMYNGYITSGCYDNFEDAHELMNKQKFCNLPDSVIPAEDSPYNYCRIFYPEEEVRFTGGRKIFCTSDFGVICSTSDYYTPFKTYTDPKCFETFEDAMKKLRSYKKPKSKDQVRTKN
jgi:hypothetical protein